MSHKGPDFPAPRDVFEDPIVQLAAFCPICALAALSPQAALSALSPTLRTFNPAINPNAALLSFLSSPQGTVLLRAQIRIQERTCYFAWKSLLRRRRW